MTTQMSLTTGAERAEVTPISLGTVIPGGAPTSITCFIVYTSYSSAPQDTATDIYSMEEFESYFGSGSSYFSPDDGYYAVRGFFENNGAGAHAIIVAVTPTGVGDESYEWADDTTRTIDGRAGELEDDGLLADTISITSYDGSTGILQLGATDLSLVRAGDYFQDDQNRRFAISSVSDSADTITLEAGLPFRSIGTVKFAAATNVNDTITLGSGIVLTAKATADHASGYYDQSGGTADTCAAALKACINSALWPYSSLYYAYQIADDTGAPVIAIKPINTLSVYVITESTGAARTVVSGFTHQTASLLDDCIDLTTTAGKIRRLPAADAYNGYGIQQPDTSRASITVTAYSVSGSTGTVSVGSGGLFSSGIIAGDTFVDADGMNWLITDVPEDDYFTVYSDTSSDTATGVQTGAGTAYAQNPTEILDTISIDGEDTGGNITFDAAAAGYATVSDASAEYPENALEGFYISLPSPINDVYRISSNSYAVGTSVGAPVGAVTVDTSSSAMFDIVRFATSVPAATAAGDVWADNSGTIFIIEDVEYATDGATLNAIQIKTSSSASTGGVGAVYNAKNKIVWVDTSFDATQVVGSAADIFENSIKIDVSDSVTLTDNDYIIVELNPQDSDFIGTQANGKGLHALDDEDQINKVLIPGGHTPTIQLGLINYCDADLGGRNDCVSILSVPPAYSDCDTDEVIVSVTVSAITAGVASLSGTPNLGSVAVGDALLLSSSYYRILAIEDDAATRKLLLDSTATVAGGSASIIRPCGITWKDYIIGQASQRSRWYFGHYSVTELSDSSTVSVDPVGHIAGAMGRIANNTQIGGVSHAPAGELNAKIAGIKGLSSLVSKKQNGYNMRTAFLNYTLFKAGVGYYLWGGYTNAGSSASEDDKLIQIDDTILFIKQSLESNLETWIWENYSASNASRVKRAIEAFCEVNNYLFDRDLPITSQYIVQSLTATSTEQDLGVLKVKLQVRPNRATRFVDVWLEYSIQLEA